MFPGPIKSSKCTDAQTELKLYHVSSTLIYRHLSLMVFSLLYNTLCKLCSRAHRFLTKEISALDFGPEQEAIRHLSAFHAISVRPNDAPPYLL
jgi:hypothetical protein